jgi:hypothetical protein
LIDPFLNRRYGANRFRADSQLCARNDPAARSVLFGMDTPTQYHEFAQACERLAIQTENEQHKKILREMAMAWRELAEKSERQNDR